MDIIGFHRELGQLYISTMGNDVARVHTDRASMQMRRDIPECFRLIVQAGVSIELIDGDTTNMNKEIIIQVLDRLKTS